MEPSIESQLCSKPEACMKRLVRVSSILALVIGCAGIPATAALASPIPKRAVFEGTSNSEYSDWGIWVSRLDGSEPERLTVDIEAEGPGAESPILSPDGLEVAFSRYEYHSGSTCIEVMGISGGRSVPVYCGSPEGVSWSPNGYELAFSTETKSSEWTAIYVLNLKTEELRKVADWYYRQGNPTFSPDGSQIAFETMYNPAEEYEHGIWIVNSNGTGLHQLIGGGGEREPSWSPSGAQIAVTAYKVTEPELEGNGIALINSSTGANEKWLLAEDGHWKYNPQWTPDGETISYTRWTESTPGEETPEVGEINTNGTEESDLFPGYTWAEAFVPQKTAAGLEVDPSYLLKRYEPRLHYDLQEQYFADSAAEATDGPSNRVLASNKETVLAAHEEPYITPSLSLLAEPEFAYGVIEEGPEHEEDAAKMHVKPEYANRDYGRVYQDPETGVYWLDYWFYYYYDSQEVLGIGVHEGDWEHVAFRLNEEGIPDLTVYSRHGSESAACESSAVQWEVTDGNTVSPDVYVANASHANYFWAGGHERFPLPEDEASGNGAIVTPEVSEVESGPYTSTAALPRWFYWTGKWGASGGGGADQESPSSPARSSNEWENLQAFAEASEENCDAAGWGGKAALRPQTRLPRPLAPKITARSSKAGVTFRYAIPKGDPPAKYLLLSVSAKNHLDATRTKTIRLGADHGVVTLPRPLAAEPYIAAGSTFTARKERSETRVASVAPKG
jgi:hypothetical protein